MDVRTILIFFVMFTVLVFVHELGHFLTARATGMRVLEFGFGFPPRLFGIQRPGTYTVVSGALTLEARGRTLSLHPGDRITVRRSRGTWILQSPSGALGLDDGERFMAGGAAAFRPSWARGDAADFRVGGGEFRAGNPSPTLFPFQPGVEYTINAIPFGGFVRILGEDGMAKLPDGSLAPDSFAARPIPARMLVLVAGVAMNFLLALVVYTLIFATGEPTFNGKVRWAHVDADSPAAAAGMRDGDVIARIDGRSFTEPSAMRDYIVGHAGTEITITVERNGQAFDLKAVPRKTPPANQGPLGLRDPEAVTELVPYPLPQAIARAADRTVTNSVEVVRVFGRIIVGFFPGAAPSGQQPDVAGPVGIYQVVGLVAQRGPVYVLELTAVLSLNLGVLNIIPFPGLDGGRLLFVVIEAIRGGRRLDPRTEAAIHALGFVFLLVIVGLVTLRDIGNIHGG